MGELLYTKPANTNVDSGPLCSKASHILYACTRFTCTDNLHPEVNVKICALFPNVSHIQCGWVTLTSGGGLHTGFVYITVPGGTISRIITELCIEQSDWSIHTMYDIIILSIHSKLQIIHCLLKKNRVGHL